MGVAIFLSCFIVFYLQKQVAAQNWPIDHGLLTLLYLGIVLRLSLLR